MYASQYFIIYPTFDTRTFERVVAMLISSENALRNYPGLDTAVSCRIFNYSCLSVICFKVKDTSPNSLQLAYQKWSQTRTFSD